MEFFGFSRRRVDPTANTRTPPESAVERRFETVKAAAEAGITRADDATNVVCQVVASRRGDIASMLLQARDRGIR